MPKTVYGRQWPDDTDPLDIEMFFVRRGGFDTSSGARCGFGLFHHFRSLMRQLWPEDDQHRWSDLILRHYCEERVTIVQGPKDCSKTHTLAGIALADYWTFPNETLWLVSSTDVRGLELRVWGDMKDLFNRARDRYPHLAGNVLESKHGIFTDKIDENEARDIRKGIICIPCIGGNGEWVGIEKMVGIKQKRRRLLADELQFMKAPYLISVEHLDKGDFKMAGSGNVIGQADPLDKMGEPVGGWGSIPETKSTQEWRNKWGGITINLDGRDSPNNDEPKNRFPYLINEADIKRTLARYGEDSATVWNQVYGKRKPGLNARRVLTHEMCLRFGAYKTVIWEGSAPRTAVYGLDAGFGGDPAIGGRIEFGVELGGQNVIKVFPPKEHIIKLSDEKTAEEQLAASVKEDMQALGIPAGHLFFDAGMFATLATNLSKTVGVDVNAVNFQGSATTRPIANDAFVFDEQTKARRLKRCDEEYSKFVTELWFSVRRVAESRQLREMQECCVMEFGAREWLMVMRNRYEMETKDDFKARLGYSPNNADWLSIAVEGARRLGFVIERLRGPDDAKEDEDDWLAREHEKHMRTMKARELNYRT